MAEEEPAAVPAQEQPPAGGKAVGKKKGNPFGNLAVVRGTGSKASWDKGKGGGKGKGDAPQPGGGQGTKPPKPPKGTSKANGELMEAATGVDLNYVISDPIERDHVVIATSAGEVYFQKYLTQLMDTGAQKNKQGSIEVLMQLHDSQAHTVYAYLHTLQGPKTYWDIDDNTIRAFDFANKADLIDKLGTTQFLKIRTVMRTLAGNDKIVMTDKNTIDVGVYVPPLSEDVPDQVPYGGLLEANLEGDATDFGAAAFGRFGLTPAQRIFYRHKLSGREESYMRYHAVKNPRTDFDVARTASINFFRGENFAADRETLFIYEPFREMWQEPIRPGQEATRAMLAAKPYFNTAQGFFEALTYDVITYNFGFVVDEAVSGGLLKAAIQDLNAKIANLEYTETKNLAFSLDSGYMVNHIIAENFAVTTQDQPQVQVRMHFDVSKEVKQSAAALMPTMWLEGVDDHPIWTAIQIAMNEYQGAHYRKAGVITQSQIRGYKRKLAEIGEARNVQKGVKRTS